MVQNLLDMYADFERHVERVPTGMIDDPIMGGIPKGSVVLLIGDPKSGKTTFISQFIHTQLTMGYSTICILVDISKYEFVSMLLTSDGSLYHTLRRISLYSMLIVKD